MSATSLNLSLPIFFDGLSLKFRGSRYDGVSSVDKAPETVSDRLGSQNPKGTFSLVGLLNSSILYRICGECFPGGVFESNDHIQAARYIFLVLIMSTWFCSRIELSC